MRHRSATPRIVVALVTALVLAGCAAEEAPLAEDLASAQPGTDQPLPEGHPSVGPPSGSSGMVLPPVAPTQGTGTQGLTWAPPKDWAPEAPSSSMRRAQYRLPGPVGDGLCVVFYFGPGQGGDVDSNANRWADEFDQPGGGSSRDVMQRREIEGSGVPVTIVEVTGMHSGGMSPMAGGGAKKEGQMLLGAIARGPDANWFFKCTGPEATMRANAEAFEGMMRSLRAGESG